jgi:hypothetical protein
MKSVSFVRLSFGRWPGLTRPAVLAFSFFLPNIFVRAASFLQAADNPSVLVAMHMGDYQTGPVSPLLTPAFGVGADPGPASENRSGQAAAGGKFAADHAPFRVNGGDEVTKNSVDGVFVEDAQAAVGEEIHFQGFQLDAIFLRHVLDGDSAEVGATGLGANGGVFGTARACSAV